MTGTDGPAIDGPAGQERGQDAVDGAVVVVEGDGLPECDLVGLERDLERCHARHSGLV